ncbi:lysozyme [Klebsiella oxytoca]|uniref:lysozyme n=1 Tax=Klebsiella oxytoca TaxID=571 RepID=UPI001CCCEC50|nr:lysozyme [Klebsiella oxytoca]MBZ7706779.1 lysozyme [Klebsiella oxytoca]
MMQTSPEGIALIKGFEGCRLTAYPDPGTGGAPWTIGYGWTLPVDGKPVRPGMTIDQATADRLLKAGLVSYESDVLKLVKVKLTQNQFDALVSFAYNVGSRALSTSTLLKKLNAGDIKGAADEFLRWNKAGGKVLNGLTRRREAERALFPS